MKATKYVTPEIATLCADRAKKRRNTYIANDAARAYVMAHPAMLREIVTAQKFMYLARYELELSVALDEDVDNSNKTHYDRAFDYSIRADKHRDNARAMLEFADDIEHRSETFKYLFTYLFDLTTI